MKNDDLIRDVDRRHVLRLFDLFSESEYDTFELIRKYSVLGSRARADQGSEYFILKQPINSYHDIVRGASMAISSEETDPVILHWMADIYLYAVYEKGLSMREAIAIADPEWLYLHYSPLHETSIAGAWEKICRISKKRDC